MSVQFHTDALLNNITLRLACQ